MKYKVFMNNNKINKMCSSCKGNIYLLKKSEALQLLVDLDSNWYINNSGHLCKQYKFKDFMSSINFANKIASVAEQIQHHPNLTIAWGKLDIEIWTHKVNSLTENDFVLASKIENIK